MTTNFSELAQNYTPGTVSMDSGLALRAPRNDDVYSAIPPSTRCAWPVM